MTWGFPGSSAGKESTCRRPQFDSQLGSYPGEGIGYPHQHSWAPLMAQMVKNLPAMPETWVWSLRWEDPLEEGMVTNPVFLPGESPWTEEPGRLQSMGSHMGSHWATKHNKTSMGFPGGASGKESACQCRRQRLRESGIASV